jgi:ribonucleoside-diphosphate reductase alpha chain
MAGLLAQHPYWQTWALDRGCPVSCSGGFVGDSVYEFYDAQRETAVLSKNGFGTSSYLGGIRERGKRISTGGVASGILPVLRDFVQLSRDVSQGNTRRGAWAGYIELEHGDFWEIADHLVNHPDDCNVGWIVTDEFISKLDEGLLRRSQSLPESLKG